MPSQAPLDFEAEDADEELAYRTFRRALKARVMTMHDRRPIQLAHSHLFKDSPHKDDPATRAWSVCVGLFYKAGGLPWRLANVQPHVCFVGLSFHRLRTTSRQLMYASMAQAFSTEVEGFVLRGDRLPWNEDQDPHLTLEQASSMGERILAQYKERAGRTPTRLTLHKTTLFTDEERTGFLDAFREVPNVELITIRASDLRLLTEENYPPRRGTHCTVNETAQYLYTTGFYPPWGTYPGPHVPSPLQLITDSGVSDLRRVCEETLGLTKMNWNSASIGGRDPITLKMAEVVGPIMAEVSEDEDPELSFRYYM